jgi:D-serine deaminase-like pyridoxal phosphate-dependent protein
LGRRAGLVPGSDQFLTLLNAIVDSTAVALIGFYCHAGTSYASKSLKEASDYLTAEISAVLDAAQVAHANFPAAKIPPLLLSVGSTPTAHALSEEGLSGLRARLDEVAGPGRAEFELHAGNYAMLDLQQIATSLVPLTSVSQRVLASVISYYPGRGKSIEGEEEDEAMCDAGGISLSKDKGPLPGFGDVVRIIRPSSSKSASSNGGGLGVEDTEWRLGRISQEHGILTRKPGAGPVKQADTLRVGDMIEIVGQHACLIAAAHPWYYVVDSSASEGVDSAGDQPVVDIWVPCKGW